MAGIKRGFVQSYLNEFMWRYMRCSSRVNTADEFIKIIRNFYPTEPGIIVDDSLKLVEENVIEEALKKIDSDIIDIADDDYDFEIEDDDEETLGDDLEHISVNDSIENLADDFINIKINPKKQSVFSKLIPESK